MSHSRIHPLNMNVTTLPNVIEISTFVARLGLYDLDSERITAYLIFNKASKAAF